MMSLISCKGILFLLLLLFFVVELSFSGKNKNGYAGRGKKFKRDLKSPSKQTPTTTHPSKSIDTIPPPKLNKVDVPEQGDSMDTKEFISHDNLEKKPVIHHVPISSRPENSECECGFHYPVEVNTTNEDGVDVPMTENDQAWQVWITFLENSKYDVKCGGSLINNKIILTSAPCVQPFKDNPNWATFLWEKRRINVIKGSSSNTTEGNSIKIAKVIIHPKYLEGKLEYQVALLVLESPVDLTIAEGVKPVCLPAQDENVRLGRDGVLPKLKFEESNFSALDEKIPQTEDYNSLYSMYDCQRIYESLDNTSAKIHLCAGVKFNYTEKYFGNVMMVEMANTQLLGIGIMSSLFFNEKKIPNTTVHLFIKVMDILPFIEENSQKAQATWCKHAVMLMNDSAPVSRITGEAWLGTQSNRIENDACVCGYRASSQPQGQGRIAGGKEATPYEYPWQVLLTISMADQPMQSADCGGTIINDVRYTFYSFYDESENYVEKFVLTAAHCIFDQYKATNPETAETIPVTDSANVKVQILVHQSEDDPRAKVLEVKKIHIHPEYVIDFKLGYQDYDIALLELMTPLDFWNVNGPLPVCLPSSADNMITGGNAIVVGWGMTDVDNADSGAKSLQQLEIPIQPLAKCKELSALEVTNRFLCAGTFNPNSDTLHGDSGGPLAVELEHKRMLQIGIVSWGDFERRKTEGLATDFSAALYLNVSQPEVLSYIDYNTKKADSRWCKKSFFGTNPRMPWDGKLNFQNTVSSDCICGMPDEDKPDQDPLKATIEFPWSVLVIKLNRPGTVSYCTGTIINSLFILTSGQCLRNTEPVSLYLRNTVLPKEVRIQLVKHETEGINLVSALRVADVYIHPDFLALEGENHFEKNIGLIRLQKPLVFTRRRKLAPICLPSLSEKSDFVNMATTITGWKRTSTNQKKQVSLETMEGKIIESNRCGKVERSGESAQFICVEPKNQTAQVKVTDGGSVTVDLPSTQMIQVAVMSHFNSITPTKKLRYADIKESMQFIEYFAHEAKATWCQRNWKSALKKKQKTTTV